MSNPSDSEIAFSAFSPDIIAAAGYAGYRIDLQTRQITWFGAADQLFNVPPASIDLFHRLIDAFDLSKRQMALLNHCSTRQPFEFEYRVQRDNGSMFWVHDKGNVSFDAHGKPHFLSGIMRCIDEQKANEATLKARANHDEVTGLVNRIRLREELQRTINRNKRYKQPGCLLILQIQHLNLIADAFGQPLADTVLRDAGQRLERIMRQSDTLGRVGPAHLGIIVQSCHLSELGIIAEKILQQFRDNPVSTSAGSIPVQAAIGGVAFPDYVSNSIECLRFAETALQRAIDRGGDTFVQYSLSEGEQQSYRDDLLTGARVMEAMKRGQLALAFQPVVNGSGQASFYECLVRMKDADGTPIPAAAFIPTIERLGFNRQLDRHVLEMGIRELKASPDIHLALNISAYTASDDVWLNHLERLLREQPELATRLIIEITETTALHDTAESARFAGTVRRLGCRIALDDFGTGHSSFDHLTALPVDIVKIAGNFVKDLGSHPHHQEFIRGLLAVTNNLGLTTVAECVETLEEASLLNKLGVHFQQGYYFGRPSLGQPWQKAAEDTEEPLPVADFIPTV